LASQASQPYPKNIYGPILHALPIPPVLPQQLLQQRPCQQGLTAPQAVAQRETQRARARGGDDRGLNDVETEQHLADVLGDFMGFHGISWRSPPRSWNFMGFSWEIFKVGCSQKIRAG